MLDLLLQLDTLQKIILNTILVSIPEELYLVMFTLILVGEFEYWTNDECKKLINKWDYTRILFPTLTVALISNIIRYSGLNFDVTGLSSIALLYILIIFTNDIFGDASAFKWAAKAFFSLFLGILILFISEFIYIPFILYGTDKTIEEINNNIFLNFIVSLPSRFLEYSILIFFIIRKRTILKANIIKTIFESKVSSFLTFTVIIFNFTFLFIMCSVVTYEKVLTNIPVELRIIVILGISLFPIINLSALIWGLYNIKNNETYKKKEATKKLNNLINEIKTYIQSDKYDSIKWKLHEVSNEIEKVSESLN